MRYLSDEWIAAAASALATCGAEAPAGHVIIDQHVDDVVSYRIIIDNNAGSLMPADPSDERAAHASFHQSLDTARAVATGATDAHQAFLLGQIRFEGQIDALIENRDAIAWVQAALDPVMAQTDFG